MTKNPSNLHSIVMEEQALLELEWHKYQQNELDDKGKLSFWLSYQVLMLKGPAWSKLLLPCRLVPPTCSPFRSWIRRQLAYWAFETM